MKKAAAENPGRIQQEKDLSKTDQVTTVKGQPETGRVMTMRDPLKTAGAPMKMAGVGE
jgi:hypothetical protein